MTQLSCVGKKTQYQLFLITDVLSLSWNIHSEVLKLDITGHHLLSKTTHCCFPVNESTREWMKEWMNEYMNMQIHEFWTLCLNANGKIINCKPIWAMVSKFMFTVMIQLNSFKRHVSGPNGHLGSSRASDCTCLNADEGCRETLWPISCELVMSTRVTLRGYATCTDTMGDKSLLIWPLTMLTLYQKHCPVAPGILGHWTLDIECFSITSHICGWIFSM